MTLRNLRENSAMRALLYYAGVVLLIPQLLIFGAIQTVQHLTSSHTLSGLFMASWNLLDLMLGWGGVAVLVIMLAIFVAGAFPLPRLIAAVALAVTAVYTTVVVIMFMEVPRLYDALFFLTPGFISLALFIALIRKEWPMTRLSAAAG